METMNKNTQKMVIMASIRDKIDCYTVNIGARLLIFRACWAENIIKSSTHNKRKVF